MLVVINSLKELFHARCILIEQYGYILRPQIHCRLPIRFASTKLVDFQIWFGTTKDVQSRSPSQL